jgi:drug/metabolite transporter (DMT)-like permease
MEEASSQHNLPAIIIAHLFVYYLIIQTYSGKKVRAIMASEQLETITIQESESRNAAVQGMEAPPGTRLLQWRGIPVTLLLMATMIWGSTFLVTQNAIKFSGPFVYLFFCFGLGALTLAAIFHRQFKHITRVDVKGGILIGFIAFVGYALQTYGLEYITTSKSGFITGLYVPLVPILAFLLFRQRVSIGALISVAVSFVGLILLSLNDTLNFSFGPGEWLSLGCAVAFAVQIICIGIFAPRANAGIIATIQLATMALFSLLAIPFAHETFSLQPLPFWLAVLFMGTVDMGFCFIAMNWAQQFIPSTQASLLYALEPVWACFFGYLAGQTLSLPAWFGCGCILLAMVAGNLRWGKKAG